MNNSYNDSPRYRAWIQKNIGNVSWEFELVSLKRSDGVMGYLEGWVIRTRDESGNIIPNKRVSEDFMGAGEALFERCDVAVKLMERDFPELTIARGYFRDPQQHGDSWMYHCWLVDSEGCKVDPTGQQFDRCTAEYNSAINEFVWDVETDSHRNGQYLAAIADVFALEGLVPDYLRDRT